MSFLVEMVVDRGVDGDEFLQTSRSAEAQRGARSSSKRQVGILGAIVFPATCFMAHVDAALVQKILDIPQRKREPDVEHHCQENDLG